MMNCHNLAEHIEHMHPEAIPRDVARLCLLLANQSDNINELEDEEQLATAWNEMGMRLQAATDQHAAMTEDLEQLAAKMPNQFTVDDIWVLIRAIKVQSQVLQLYVGQPALDL